MKNFKLIKEAMVVALLALGTLSAFGAETNATDFSSKVTVKRTSPICKFTVEQVGQNSNVTWSAKQYRETGNGIVKGTGGAVSISYSYGKEPLCAALTPTFTLAVYPGAGSTMFPTSSGLNEFTKSGYFLTPIVEPDGKNGTSYLRIAPYVGGGEITTLDGKTTNLITLSNGIAELEFDTTITAEGAFLARQDKKLMTTSSAQIAVRPNVGSSISNVRGFTLRPNVSVGCKDNPDKNACKISDGSVSFGVAVSPGLVNAQNSDITDVSGLKDGSKITAHVVVTVNPA